MPKKVKAANPYNDYQIHSHDNYLEIIKSKTAGCYFCRHEFNARDIQDFDDEDGKLTAKCPECGMDAIIGDASGLDISKKTLHSVNLYYYSEDYFKNNPEAAARYVARYINGKITHNEKNERFHIKYLTCLANLGDPRSALLLALFYEKGSEFSKPDLDKAAKWLSSKSLKNDDFSLARLGYLYQRGYGLKDGENGIKNAFDCYVKSSMLSGIEGKFRLADLFYEGIYVKQDKELARKTYSLLFESEYFGYLIDSSSCCFNLCELAFRMGKISLELQKDGWMALGYFLISKYAYEISLKDSRNFPITFLDYLNKFISDLASKNHLHSQPPVFDAITFVNTFITFADQSYPPAKLIKDFDYDKNSGHLYLKIFADYLPLVIDIENLYAGQPGKTLEWYFEGVSSFRIKEEKELLFQKVIIEEEDGDEIWSLFDPENYLIAQWRINSNKPLKVSHKRPSKKKKTKKEGE